MVDCRSSKAKVLVQIQLCNFNLVFTMFLLFFMLMLENSSAGRTLACQAWSRKFKSCFSRISIF